MSLSWVDTFHYPSCHFIAQCLIFYVMNTRKWDNRQKYFHENLSRVVKKAFIHTGQGSLNRTEDKLFLYSMPFGVLCGIKL